jgi:tRNA-splicing ligase RtcB (3'-phosphate/5'-hydroxy nucleic acid ligase)
MSRDIRLSDPRVKLFITDEIDFSALSRDKLKEALSLEDIKEIIVLADIHSKPDNPFPTGIVTLTANTIYPFAIGQEIGCGMRVLKTSLNSKDLNANLIDSIFNNLKTFLRDGLNDKPLLNKKEYFEVLINGYEWAKGKFGIEKEREDYLSRISYRPQENITVKDIRSALPKDALWGGYYRLGALGGGNHFLEIQVVRDILDNQAALKFGLSKGQVIFIFHTGSGTFSKRLDNYYGTRFENNRLDKDIRKYFRKLLFHFGDLNLTRFSKRWSLFFGRNFKGIPADSIEGKRYMAAFKMAMNYSFVNRAIISSFIQEALKQSLKRDISVQLLSDTTHERIDREEFDKKEYWVHRNGATKVSYDPQEIMLIPAFMGGPSFLCMSDNAVSQTRYSVNHGVGRLFDKQESREKFNTEEIYNVLKSKEIRLYKLGNEDIREQAPGAFKDIDKVMQSLKTHKLVNPVATTVPLAILKG